MKLIILNAISITFAIGAIYLAANELNGWGWFIFGSVCTFTYPKRINL